MNEILHLIKTPIFNVAGKGFSLVDLSLIVLLLFGGFWLANRFKHFMINSAQTQRLFEDGSLRYIFGNFGKYIILIITFFTVVQTVGINMSSLTVVMGALTVGIGFGLQNIVNNFISGIILMTERSIKVGDMVEIGANTGRVAEIRLRSTVIRTLDSVEIVIPNSELVGSQVINRTLSSPLRRIALPFGVAYGTSVASVNETVLGALNKSALVFAAEPAPYIKMSALGASSVDFNLYVYVDQNNPASSHPGDFLALIYEALNAANISIPFPQLDLNLKGQSPLGA